MNCFTLSALTIFGLFFVSCGNEKANSTTEQNTVSSRNNSSTVDSITRIVTNNEPSTTIDTSVVKEEEVSPKQLKSGDYAVVKGILNRVEESEYGPSWLRVDVNGTFMKFEGSYAKGQDSMIGQELVITYVYLEFLNEADIHLNDTSVRSGWDGGGIVTEEDKNQPGLQKVEGVISWTSHEYGVSGDISPSEYGLIKADGTKIKITGRVYEELFLKLNGKQASVYYYPSSEMLVSTINNPLKKKDSQTKLDFIREKSSTITNNIEAQKYTNTEFEIDGNSAVARYKRAMDGDELRFMSLSYDSGYGSVKTSYYFWGGQLIFEFIEEFARVDDKDKVYEKRNYYYDMEHIHSLERELSGSGGYEAVKKQLSNKQQTTLPPGQPFNLDLIATYFDVSEKRAKRYPYIFFPDDNR